MSDPQVIVAAPTARAPSVVNTQQRVAKVNVSPGSVAQLQSTFETLGKNMLGLPAAFTRTNGAISAVVYGNGELVKTLLRTPTGAVSAVVLTGSKLGNYELTKTFNRGSSGELIGFTYSQLELP